MDSGEDPTRARCQGVAARWPRKMKTMESQKPVSEMTESELRDRKGAWPKSIAELSAEVSSLVDRGHDYGTCVYAASMAAEAAYNYVLSTLGCTGFQASCADMDFLRRTRGMKHGFMILNGSDVLYPQYDLVQKARDFVDEQKKSLKAEAALLLATKTSAHPAVIARWEELAGEKVDE